MGSSSSKVTDYDRHEQPAEGVPPIVVDPALEYGLEYCERCSTHIGDGFSFLLGTLCGIGLGFVLFGAAVALWGS